MVCLYPSTTQVLQPLDVAFFKPLKVFWVRERSLYKFKKKLQIEKFHVPIILQEIFENPNYDLVKSIKNGFRKCGLCPFNPDNVDYTSLPTYDANTQPPEDIVSPQIDSPQMSALDFIESKLDENLVMHFKTEHKSVWTGDEKHTSLFNFWRDLRKDNRSYSILNERLESMEPALCVSNLQYESLSFPKNFQFCIDIFFSFRKILKSLSTLKYSR